jgi:hypothetical protein
MVLDQVETFLAELVVRAQRSIGGLRLSDLGAEVEVREVAVETPEQFMAGHRDFRQWHKGRRRAFASRMLAGSRKAQNGEMGTKPSRRNYGR